MMSKAPGSHSTQRCDGLGLPQASERLYCVFDARESVLASIIKDATTFGLMLVCIRASMGSVWWLAISVSLFLLVLSGKMSRALTRRRHTFYSVDELQAWAADLAARERMGGEPPPRDEDDV